MHVLRPFILLADTVQATGLLRTGAIQGEYAKSAVIVYVICKRVTFQSTD